MKKGTLGQGCKVVQDSERATITENLAEKEASPVCEKPEHGRVR